MDIQSHCRMSRICGGRWRYNPRPLRVFADDLIDFYRANDWQTEWGLLSVTLITHSGLFGIS
jgi:hypothetical protein